MLKCEGLTIRQLCDQFSNDENDKIDEVVTKYLQDKPGTWRLISATSSQFGWYFIWMTGE